MTKVRALALGLVLVLVGSTTAEDKKEFDAAKLIGKWQVTAGTKDGKAASEEGVKSTVLIVEKEKMTLKTGIGDFVMKYKIDAKASPMTIDLEIADGPDASAKGHKSKGIISLDGEVLKLAYHPMGGDRPKNFDAKEKTGEYSFTTKKVKADK